MLELLGRGAEVFDYGNNLRGHAKEMGVENAFEFEGFVPKYIRPQFCEGRGPFRWAALSGDPADIAVTDRIILELFPDDEHLARWIRHGRRARRVPGLPARICWLGYGERARAGLAFNEAVRRGEISAPVVIGRDHLDCGSVASPNRETEAMKDGTDAVADWAMSALHAVDADLEAQMAAPNDRGDVEAEVPAILDAWTPVPAWASRMSTRSPSGRDQAHPVRALGSLRPRGLPTKATVGHARGPSRRCSAAAVATTSGRCW